MKKKILALFISIALIFSTTPAVVFAAEGEEITTTIVQPQKPQINDDTPIEEANAMINNYNNEVDNYNQQAALENEKIDKQNQENKDKTDEHNAEEQKKVDENKEALEKQAKLEAKKEADAKSKVANQTTDSEQLPDSWTDTDQSATTIQVVQKDSEGHYKVTNLHLYVDEDAEDTYTGTQLNDTNFYINDDIKEHLVLGEWETIMVGYNDTVTVLSESNLYPHSGAVFLRRLEGYTNGYWMPTEEFISNAKYEQSTWQDGPATEFSFEDGTVDRQAVKDVLNIFVYNFIRAGAEPEKVEKYQPDFWEYPENIPYLEMLEKLEKLTPEQATEAGIEVEVTEDPEQEVTEEKPVEIKDDEIIVKVPSSGNKTKTIKVTIKDTPEKLTTDAKVEKPIQEKEEKIIPTPEIVEPTTPVIEPVIPTIEPITPTIQPITPTIEPVITNTIIPNEPVTNPVVPHKTAKINDNETPLAKEKSVIPILEHWALVNLILTIITMLCALKLPKEENDKRYNNFFSILIAIGAVIVFIFTENVRLPMTLVDQHTFMMFLIAISGIVCAMLTKDYKKEDNSEKEE